MNNAINASLRASIHIIIESASRRYSTFICTFTSIYNQNLSSLPAASLKASIHVIIESARRRDIVVMDIFLALLEVGKIIYTPIKKCVKYHICLDESMEILEEGKLKDLNTRKTGIENKIEVDRRCNKDSVVEVNRWLEKVQKINDGMEKLKIDVAQGKFLSRFCLGMRVDDMIEEVGKLYEEGGRFTGGLMTDAIPSGVKTIPIGTPLAGTLKKEEEIWKSLISEDVLKIGVSGMGGCGKTTIMKLISNRVLEQKDKFDNVYWITVPKEANVSKLQEGIASAFKLEVFNESTCVVERAAMLFNMLKEKKKYVLIFDDVWKEFNLGNVGIPEPTTSNGCKLILTTRLSDVCQKMDCKEIKMELLSKDEAWTLFLAIVGRDFIMVSGLEKIAKQVAKECARLPLAIVTVGTSMKGVVDMHEWTNASNELRHCRKGLTNINEEVIKRLKCSYERLNDENARSCLLYCALYPEDCAIKTHELISYLIAEEIIEGMESRKYAFNKGHSILNTLKRSCLLESWSDPDDDGTECVKMHDMIRDMALQLMESESIMVECGMQAKEFPEDEKWNDNLERVSLMDANIKEIPDNLSPRCRMLKTLRLSKNKMLTSIPDSFFLHMPSLCVLDLSHTGIESLPKNISELENLTALVLRGSDVRYVPSLAKLQRLRVLDLCNTFNIEQVPEGMGMLVKLEYLNIERSGAKTFPIGILPNLIRLQFFSALFTPDTLEIKVEELMCLKKLQTLGCRLSSVDDFNSYTGYLQTYRPNLPKCYDVHVGVGSSGDYLELNESQDFNRVRVALFKEEEEGERSIVVLPNNVKEVSIAGEKSSRLPFVEGALWFNVEVLEFVRLNKLRVLVDDIDRSQLQLMSHGSNGTIFSSCLRELSVCECPKLKHLFKLELVLYFPNLESVSVRDCDEMEELVAVEEEDRDEEHSIVNDAAVTITFPKLRSLKLDHLPELKSIVCRSGIMVCDSIEEIGIGHCWKLKRLPLYLPPQQHNDQPSPPASLKVIKVHQRWWDSLEWDDPIAKDVLQRYVNHSPFVDKYYPYYYAPPAMFSDENPNACTIV